jgi:hypothetical protein
MIADNLLIKRSHSHHLTVMFENRHILLGQLTSNSHEIKNAPPCRTTKQFILLGFLVTVL